MLVFSLLIFTSRFVDQSHTRPVFVEIYIRACGKLTIFSKHTPGKVAEHLMYIMVLNFKTKLLRCHLYYFFTKCGHDFEIYRFRSKAVKVDNTESLNNLLPASPPDLSPISPQFLMQEK